MSTVLTTVWVRFTAPSPVVDYYIKRYVLSLTGRMTTVEPLPENHDVVEWHRSSYPNSVDIRISKHGQEVDLEAIRDYIAALFTPDVEVGIVARVDGPEPELKTAS